MGTREFFKRLFLLVILWPALFASQFATGAQTHYELKGVLISPNSRSALINTRIARVGETVDGAEILAIEEDHVRLLLGSDEYTVLVGSAALMHQRAAPTTRPSAYRVRQGDTLSGIAERYAGDGLTINQVMIALFEANPQAFEGNINRLLEGASLEVPDRATIEQHSFAVATSEVVRQTRSWRTPPGELPDTPMVAERYGPVAGGETLSGIAAKVSQDDVSLNQIMIALFEANPQAFDGNINMLRKGAVLQLPGPDLLDRISHETATAEVLRQTESWRARYASLPGAPTTEPALRPAESGDLVAGLIRRQARRSHSLLMDL